MAFNTNPGKQSFTATSAQTEFNFNFKIYEDTDLKVYQTPAGQDPNDANDLLTLTTDYTVTINGDNGGTVTLVTGATLNDTIVIARDLPQTRDTSYVTNGDLKATTLNIDQDYQTYLIIDGYVALQNAVQLPQSAVGVDPVLPNVRPDSYLKWNSAGDALENDETIPDAVITSGTNATNAANSAAAAATSETNASTSETNASNSASAAATSASNASTSETNASTSETNASNSASAAATSETNASTSETNASNSASAAATSASNAETAYDNFDDRYLGAKASDPTLDNDGDALITGALYFNTTSSVMKVYNGSTWDAIDTLTIASTAEAQAGTDNSKAISPLRLFEAFQGANQSIGSSSFYQKLPGGLIIQGGIVSPGTAGNVTITLPMSFTAGVYVAIAGWSSASSSGVDGSAPVIRVVNNSQIQVYRSTSLSDNWLVIGK